eukprot:1690136-Pyramimonas_sp.AAC.1
MALSQGTPAWRQGLATTVLVQRGEAVASPSLVGDAYGLGLYKEEKLAWAAVDGVSETEMASVAGQSLLYFPATEVPFEDLDDIERCQWRVRAPMS